MAEEQKSGAAAPKSSPITTMVGMLAVALAAGGGMYFFLGGKAGTAGEIAKQSGHEAAARLPAQYVRLDPPFVVNFEAKGMMRFLQVAIEVMSRDPETMDLIKKNEPMIRNDLILLFGNQKYESISTREGKEQLRAEALATVANVVGAEGGDATKVEQLYFTSFVMQ